MEAKSVSFLALFDSTKDLMYALNYDKADSEHLLGSITSETDDISIYRDHMLLLYRNNDLCLALLAMPGANEVFVKDAFDNFATSLDRIIKHWTHERVAEKYDQIVLTFNEFVFHGIILTDQSKELGGRIMKRTFENINGIKMKKGLASFINRATKSLRNN